MPHKAAAELGMPPTILRTEASGGHEHYVVRMILVRPDQFVAWAGEVPLAGEAALLRKAIGQSI